RRVRRAPGARHGAWLPLPVHAGRQPPRGAGPAPRGGGVVKRPITVFQFVYRILAYNPGNFLANAAAWGLFHLAPLAIAALIKAIFDTLSGAAGAGWNPWSLLAIFLDRKSVV